MTVHGQCSAAAVCSTARRMCQAFRRRPLHINMQSLYWQAPSMGDFVSSKEVYRHGIAQTQAFIVRVTEAMLPN